MKIGRDMAYSSVQKLVRERNAFAELILHGLKQILFKIGLISLNAFVDCASVPDNGDVDKPVGIVDGINHAIIANADSPEGILAG